MVTMHVITADHVSSDLLLSKVLHLYETHPEVIQTTSIQDDHIRVKFVDWPATAIARDFLEQFGERYNVQDVEWL